MTLLTAAPRRALELLVAIVDDVEHPAADVARFLAGVHDLDVARVHVLVLGAVVPRPRVVLDVVAVLVRLLVIPGRGGGQVSGRSRARTPVNFRSPAVPPRRARKGRRATDHDCESTQEGGSSEQQAGLTVRRSPQSSRDSSSPSRYSSSSLSRSIFLLNREADPSDAEESARRTAMAARIFFAVSPPWSHHVWTSIDDQNWSGNFLAPAPRASGQS